MSNEFITYLIVAVRITVLFFNVINKLLQIS